MLPRVILASLGLAASVAASAASGSPDWSIIKAQTGDKNQKPRNLVREAKAFTMRGTYMRRDDEEPQEIASYDDSCYSGWSECEDSAAGCCPDDTTCCGLDYCMPPTATCCGGDSSYCYAGNQCYTVNDDGEDYSMCCASDDCSLIVGEDGHYTSVIGFESYTFTPVAGVTTGVYTSIPTAVVTTIDVNSVVDSILSAYTADTFDSTTRSASATSRSTSSTRDSSASATSTGAAAATNTVGDDATTSAASSAATSAASSASASEAAQAGAGITLDRGLLGTSGAVLALGLVAIAL